MEPKENTIVRYLRVSKPIISNMEQSGALHLPHKVHSLDLASCNRNTPIGDVKPTPHENKLAQDVKNVEKCNTTSTFQTKKCFKCHGYSHIASTYTNRRLISFTKQGTVKVDEEKSIKDVPNDEY